MRQNSDRSAERKKKVDSRKEKEEKVVPAGTRHSQSVAGEQPLKTKPVVVASEESESSSQGGEHAADRGDNSVAGAEEGDSPAAGADKKDFHIDVPKEDFGNWLDQLEVKVGCF